MRAEVDGESTSVPAGNGQRLLGYLVLHRRTAHRREVLAETLWPGTGEQSRRSLSDTLYRLRRQLGDGWLVVDRDTVAATAAMSTDVWEFDRLVVGATPDDLERASELYVADLLPGVYDDWAIEHRTARHRALVAALERIVATREEAGELQRALLDARRLIVAEPLNEPAHQTYLRLLGRLHRYGEAIAHFEDLQRLMAEELGVAPLAATTRIVNDLVRERDLASGFTIDAPARFVGRVADRANALRGVEGVFHGRGGVVCVEGVAGIGKTRLLGEVIGSARWRGAVVLVGDVRAVPEATPLAPLARALAPILAGPQRAHVESVIDPVLLPTLAPLWPDWAPAGGPHPSTHRDAGRLELALRLLGRALTDQGPLVLVLDDLHWARPATWEALTALTDGLLGGGGLVVAAYRRPDVETTAGWSVLQSWDRRGVATFIPLEALDAGDVAEMVDADEVDVSEVVALTGGVPFYVTQWLQASRADRRFDGATIVRRRRAALNPRHRHALEGAAVLGESIPFPVWMEVVDLPPLELATISEDLAADRWITPTAAGHAFTHDLLRTVLYDRISARRRRMLHERAASALARLEPENSRARAYHLDCAGLTELAADAYRETGSSHRATSAFGDAVEAWSRALELLPHHRRRDRLDLTLDLAEVCDVISDHDRQRPVLAEALATARDLGDEAAELRALLLAAGAAVRAGETEEGQRTLDQARRLAERLGDRRSLADAHYRTADLLIQTGRWPEGELQFHAALALVEREDDPWLHGRVLRGLAISAVRQGRPTDAVRWLEEALAGYRADGDPLNELVTAANLLTAYYEVGSWDSLVETAQQTLPLARTLGDPVNTGIVCQGLGLGALAMGDRVTARAMLAETEACWVAAGRPRLVGAAMNSRGLVAEDDGDDDEAMALYRAALAASREIDAATDEAYASHDLGALLVRLGRADEAIPLLRTAARHWADAGNRMLQAKSEACLGFALLAVDGPGPQVFELADAGVALLRSGTFTFEQPQGWLWWLYRLLRELDRPADAGEALRAARDDLVRQARSIADPGRRRGFFERVPLNRAIMAEVAERASASSVVVVRLARTDAPLGRRLRDEEFVDVSWTVYAPDDEVVTGRAARRRHRLLRLLDEAARNGAAPTDDDLAEALGVSRRTVIRDMAVIGSDAGRATTRRRGSSQRASPGSV
jgi:DNA-binding SARP family transcriptional activator/tetratricopeptide (TPR) repeat protein